MKHEKIEQKFEEIVKALKNVDNEIMKINVHTEQAVWGDKMHKVAYESGKISKEDGKAILSEIQEKPENFFSLSEKYFADFGFCAEAMQTCVKAYKKKVSKAVAQMPDLDKKTATSMISAEVDDFKVKVVEKVSEQYAKRKIEEKQRRDEYDQVIEERVREEWFDVQLRAERAKRNK